MWTRRELKKNAEKAMRTNYWKTFFSSLVAAIIMGGTTYSVVLKSADSLPQTLRQIYENEFAGPGNYDWKMLAMLMILGLSSFFIYTFVRLAITFLVQNPMTVGYARFLYKTVVAAEEGDEDGKGTISDNLWAFDHHYLNHVKVMFFRSLYMGIGYLLFFIPGAVMAYQYRMVPYVLAENPELSRKEALQLSKDMMNGHKWNTFKLDLSFLLWHLLGVLTFGVVEIFYVELLEALTNAELYKTVSTLYYEKE